MRCWVTTDKHVSNARAIARQLLGKGVQAAADTHATVEVLLDYKNGNGVFMWFLPKYYKQGQWSSGD
jgi:hypothetical protein